MYQAEFHAEPQSVMITEKYFQQSLVPHGKKKQENEWTKDASALSRLPSLHPAIVDTQARGTGRGMIK